MGLLDFFKAGSTKATIDNAVLKLSQKPIIAEELLKLLIEKHDDGDSLVKESNLKNSLSSTFNFTPTTEEISEAVNLINSHSNRRAIIEGWIGIGGGVSSSNESSYITEAPISFLYELISLVK